MGVERDATRASPEQLRAGADAGEFSFGQLRLAAYLGDPAAARAVGEKFPPRALWEIDAESEYGRAIERLGLRSSYNCLDELIWLRGLARWGLVPVARAGIEWTRTRPYTPTPEQLPAFRVYRAALAAWLEARLEQIATLCENPVVDVLFDDGIERRIALFSVGLEVFLSARDGLVTQYTLASARRVRPAKPRTA